MSGGSHDYAFQKLLDIADSFHYEEPRLKHIEERQKVAKILRIMSEICHDIEWIDSGDMGGEEDWEKVNNNLDRIEIKEIE